VTQTNSSAAESAAGNLNATKQKSDQQQSGGSCCTAGGTQTAGQAADNHQDADSTASSTQTGASNVNTPVRIFSPGNSGAVTQTNVSLAASGAVNLNGTEQTADQEQTGCCAPTKERMKPSPCCEKGAGVQAIGQYADNHQSATSEATSEQDHPSNTNTPVRIGSKGDDGAVTQTNVSAALSGAGNLNLTDQSATQQQAGGLGTGVQAIGQKAENDQYADSAATSTQSGASNTNAPVRIGSAGAGGTVEQTNASIALSGAGNLNLTKQTATQLQGGGACCSLGTGVQAIGQKAKSSQDATSKADATQDCPSNVNAPVRIKSEGAGGAVKQANASAALSGAGNLNATDQSATQEQAGGCCGPAPKPLRSSPCCDGGVGVQAIGQFAHNEQTADSTADSTQRSPSNSNAPVREYSPGADGEVTQSNDSLATSLALNLNLLHQVATQQQGGAI
jgi:hypothetical protein